jgi:hypothetical protein
MDFIPYAPTFAVGGAIATAFAGGATTRARPTRPHQGLAIGLVRRGVFGQPRRL